MINEIENNVLEMLDTASKAIQSEGIDNAEFSLCRDIIMASLEYLESKRSKQYGFSR